MLEDQKAEIVTLRKLVQAMADRQNAELALENKQLKLRVANLEAEIAHIKADGIIAHKGPPKYLNRAQMSPAHVDLIQMLAKIAPKKLVSLPAKMKACLQPLRMF